MPSSMCAAPPGSRSRCARHWPPSSLATARNSSAQLVADGRLGEDVFTTYLGHAQQGPRFEVSELATHNAPGEPYWMAIGGAVFDVTEFQHLHIGGAHIVRNHVGLDATAAYRKVLHHAHSEIDAQLAMYEIGHLRRLDLATAGVWFSPKTACTPWRSRSCSGPGCGSCTCWSAWRTR